MDFEKAGISRPAASKKPVMTIFIWFFRGIGLVWISIALSAVTGAALEKPAGDPSVWPQEASDLPPDPSMSFGRLENGFRYVLMENPTPPERVSMHLLVMAGSLHETEDERGAAHFLEHMLFNGTTHFQPGELVRYFQSIGMQFGPDANAHTGFFETVYDVLLPDAKPEHISQGLMVLKDYAEGALLLDDEVEKEKRVILSEKRDRDSASYRILESRMAFEFPDLLISRRLPIGIEATIESMTAGRLRSFYDAWYRPERMVLVMVGDMDAISAREMVARTFSSMKSRADARPEPDFGKIVHEGVRPFHLFEPETGQTDVSIRAYRSIPRPVDSEKTRHAELLLELGVRMLQYRLDERVKRAGAPFTDAGGGAGTHLRKVEYAVLTADCHPERWEAALSELEQALRSALEHGFLPAELDRAKKEIAAELRKDAAEAATRSSRDLAGQIIDSLSEARVHQSPMQILSRLEPVIANATPGQVHERFKNAWDIPNRLLLVTGDAKIDGDPAKAGERILRVFRESRETAVSAPMDLGHNRFPYLEPLVDGGKIVSESFIEDVGVRSRVFHNGVRVLSKKTDFEANQVKIKAIFGTGRSGEPADQPGIGRVAESLVNESGVGGLDPEELDRALAGTQTRLAFKVEEDGFAFEMEGVSQEVELAFQLLYAHILDPAFRQDRLEQIRERYLQAYQARFHTIEGALSLSVPRLLASGDTRFGYPPPEVVAGYDTDRIRQWVEPALRDAPLEVCVVGDFDEPSLDALARRYLGGLPVRTPRRSFAPSRPGPVFPEGVTHRLEVKTQTRKSAVILAYPSDDRWDIELNRRLGTLAEIFSERLREKIREEQGDAYAPTAFNRASAAYDGYGVFQIIVQVDPERQAAVTGSIKAISRELAAGGVSPQELQRAIDPILTGIKEHRRTNDYWLQTVLSGASARPEQIEWSRSMLSGYRSITAEQMNSVALGLLKEERAAVVLLDPGGHMHRSYR